MGYMMGDKTGRVGGESFMVAINLEWTLGEAAAISPALII
jgi:hypothetical protein